MFREFKKIITVCTVALAGMSVSASCPALTTPNVAPAEQNDDVSEDGSWVAILVTENIIDATTAVGGNWLSAAELGQSSKHDSYYDGFLLPHINSAYIAKKSVLDKFVAPANYIVDQYFNEITFEEYQKLPIEKIICAGILTGTFEGKKQVGVRLVLNNNDFKRNHSTDVTAVMEVVGLLKSEQKD